MVKLFVQVCNKIRVCLVTYFLTMFFAKNMFWRQNFLQIMFFFFFIKYKIWFLHFQNMLFAFLIGFQTDTTCPEKKKLHNLWPKVWTQMKWPGNSPPQIHVNDLTILIVRNRSSTRRLPIIIVIEHRPYTD